MRFLLVKLKIFVGGLIVLGGCSSAPSVKEPSQDSFSETKARRLEEKEFKESDDPAIKEALAKKHWCRGERGMAVQHWQWIRHFRPESSEADRAREFLLLIQDKNESRVSGKLSCSP